MKIFKVGVCYLVSDATKNVLASCRGSVEAIKGLKIFVLQL